MLLELSCCLLEFIDVAAIISQGIAWSKSAPNRQARQLAKTTGAELPPRDGWFQFFVFLTPIVLTLTGIVIFRLVRRLTR